MAQHGLIFKEIIKLNDLINEINKKLDTLLGEEQSI